MKHNCKKSKQKYIHSFWDLRTFMSYKGHLLACEGKSSMSNTKIEKMTQFNFSVNHRIDAVWRITDKFEQNKDHSFWNYELSFPIAGACLVLRLCSAPKNTQKKRLSNL